MNCTNYTRFRDIDSSVLETIKSSYRGGDISALINWGQETGLLSKDGRKIVLHLICDMCGKRVDKPLYEQRKALKSGSRDAYCSKKCCSTHHATKNSKKCEVCEKPSKHRHARYCSDACKLVARAERRVKKQCPQCSKIFHGFTMYCSGECADEVHSQRMRGLKNSKFKQIGRYSNQYIRMREFVLDRDAARCVACGSEGKDMKHRYGGKRASLHCHHINENTRDNRPQNLIIMCMSCHKKHHHGVLELSPRLSAIACLRSASMTSKWKDSTISLLKEFSSTTASS